MGWDWGISDCVGGREEQQDRVAVFTGQGCVLAVVADGLGGHRGGAAAAQAVVDSARRQWEATPRPVDAIPAFLEALRVEAHGAICGLAAEFGEPPYSTCVLFHADGEKADWVHAGDSRVYRIRNGAVEQMTRDHSYAQVLVDQGKLDPQAVASHPSQGQLLVALGGREDQGGELGGAWLRPGDAFCLCSDGAWENLTPEDMVNALAQPDLGAAAKALTERAALIGGASGDNIAVALLRIGSPPLRRRSFWSRLFGRGGTP